MASRQRLINARREWQADEAARSGDPGFRGIVSPGPQAAPGDETYLGNETRVATGDLVMVTGMVGGGHVIVSRLGSGLNPIGVHAFDASGNLLWVKAITAPANMSYGLPSVAGLADGGVIVVFQGNTSSLASEIYGQRYDADGNTAGPLIFTVNTITAGNQNWPNVTALEGGGFLVAWGTSITGGTDEIRGQIYNAAGAAVGGNFQLNAANTSLEGRPVVDALPGGGFVAVWVTQDSISAPLVVLAQRFDTAGQRVGPEIIVGETNAEQVDVSALSDGGFVIGWSYDNSSNDGSPGTGGQVYARRYGPDGTPAPEGLITVIETNTGHIGHYAFGGGVTVEGLDSNYFLVTWVNSRPAVSTVYGRVYNAVGQSTSGVFIANQTTIHDHYLMNGGTSLVANDTVVLAWEAIPDSGPGTDNLSVFFRRIGIEVPDAIMGTPGADSLNGTANSDLIYGLASDDVINGGASADRMEGGLGNDTYAIDNAGDQVMEAVGAGFDAIFTGISYALTAGTSVEWLSTTNTGGTGAINLTGNEIVNHLVGNCGANTLDGGASADFMTGFLGDDIYIIDNAGDGVAENAGEGSDAALSSVSYALAAGASVEWLSTTNTGGTGAINLTGNEIANTLVGNNGANTLNGGGGADLMTGFLGDDVYVVDNVGDVIVENAAEGFDAILASATYGLAGGVSVEWLSTTNTGGTAAINLTGNEIVNNLVGNNGANTLNGGGGADVMVGFLGDDVYFADNAGDVVAENAGGGFDAVLASVSYALTAGASVEWLSTTNTGGTVAINLTGNEIGNTLVGNFGANTLNGGAAADAMTGFAGDDVYIVDNAGDLVVENADQGFDAILTGVSYALAAGQSVEWLSTTNTGGTGAIDLTGNEIANNLIGNNGANMLNGGGGSDVMTGFAGADSFAFTAALGATNIDTIADFSVADDTISLDDAIFSQAGPLGTLNANAFVTGTAAADGSDRIIYDSATGRLFYDADGNGAGAQVHFATLSTGLSLTAGDFTVI